MEVCSGCCLLPSSKPPGFQKTCAGPQKRCCWDACNAVPISVTSTCIHRLFCLHCHSHLYERVQPQQSPSHCAGKIKRLLLKLLPLGIPIHRHPGYQCSKQQRQINLGRAVVQGCPRGRPTFATADAQCLTPKHHMGGHLQRAICNCRDPLGQKSLYFTHRRGSYKSSLLPCSSYHGIGMLFWSASGCSVCRLQSTAPRLQADARAT